MDWRLITSLSSTARDAFAKIEEDLKNRSQPSLQLYFSLDVTPLPGGNYQVSITMDYRGERHEKEFKITDAFISCSRTFSTICTSAVLSLTGMILNASEKTSTES